jgi:50S ribosomal subunit-associated GTPase HflX
MVLDVSDPAAALHLETVHKTLDDVFEEVQHAEERAAKKAEHTGARVDRWTPPPRQLILNKIDRLADNRELLVWKQKEPDAIAVCSLPDEHDPKRLRTGHDAVVARVRRAAMGDPMVVDITVPLADSRTIHVIENRGVIHDRTYGTETVTLRAEIGTRQLAQLRSAGARMTVTGDDGADARSNGWKPAPDPDA